MANFRQFENDLKNFLIKRIKNKKDEPTLIRKYNNIKITMNHKKFDRPHFIIRLGISEAAFDIDTAIILSGGLGNEVMDVRTWITRFMKKSEMKVIWQTDYKEYLKKKEAEENAQQGK
jgi:hypothetical protein